MALSLQHTYECDFCSTLVQETQTKLVPECTIRRQMIPSGWTWVGHRLACTDHEVTVDGAAVVLAQKNKAIA